MREPGRPAPSGADRGSPRETDRGSPLEADRFAGVAHPLLASIPAAIFLYAAYSSFRDLGGGFFQTGLVLLPLLLGTGFLAALFNAAAGKERLGFAPKFSALVLLGLIVYAGASLAIALDPADLGRPGPANILPAAMAMAQWFLSTTLLGFLGARELYLRAIDASRTDDELERESREAGELLAEAHKDLRWLRSMLAAFPGFVFVLNFLQYRSGFPFSTETLVFSGLCYLGHPVARFLVAQYMGEQHLASRGLRPLQAARYARSNAAFAALAGCALLAFALSSDLSCIPPAATNRALAFTESILPRPRERSTELSRPPEPAAKAGDEELAEGGGPQMPLLDFSPAMNGIAIVLLAAAGLAFCVLVIGPIISPRLRAYLAQSAPVAFLRRKLKAIIALIRGRRAKGRGNPLSDPSAARIRKMLEALGAQGRSEEKRREIGRMVKAFLRLTAWGRPRGYRYGATSSPLEYARAIAAALPALGREALVAGETIEEALFSLRLLGAEKIARYEAAIEGILEYKEPRKT